MQVDDSVCFPPVAKKLGGSLDVVSYHDEVEGSFLAKVKHLSISILYDLRYIINVRVSVQLKENPQVLHQEFVSQK